MHLRVIVARHDLIALLRHICSGCYLGRMPVGHFRLILRRELGDLDFVSQLLLGNCALHGHQRRMWAAAIEVGSGVLSLSLGSCLP